MYQTKLLLERDYYTTFSPGAQEQKKRAGPFKAPPPRVFAGAAEWGAMLVNIAQERF